MATTAAPDGVILDSVILEVAVVGGEGSPSQERLVRIAAMLREAEQAAPVGGRDRRRRGQRERRTARARRAA